MTFYLNPFDSTFRGNLVFSDRKYNITFEVGPNVNSSQLMATWVSEPYNVSSLKNLSINYSFDSGRTWSNLVIDTSTTAASAAAAKASEIASALNADATFSAILTAFTNVHNNSSYLLIRAKRERTEFKIYFDNTGAEQILHFNKKAPIVELPTYFERHTIENIPNYTDSVGMLMALDPVVTYDATMIDDAGLDSSTVQDDWQLLRGRCGLFEFKKITIDGSNRVTQIIEYPAGALAGDMGKKTDYTYSGLNTSPSQITEIPYVITSSDLVTPP